MQTSQGHVVGPGGSRGELKVKTVFETLPGFGATNHVCGHDSSDLARKNSDSQLVSSALHTRG